MMIEPMRFSTHVGRLFREACALLLKKESSSGPAPSSQATPGLSLSAAAAERHRRHAAPDTDPTPGTRTDPSRFGGRVLSYSGAPSHPPTPRAYGESAGMQTDVPKIIQCLPNGRPPTGLSPTAPERHQHGPQAPFEPLAIPMHRQSPARAVGPADGVTR